MLLNSCNFRIHSLETSAGGTDKSNLSRIALKSTVDESCNLSVDVTCLFGISEGTVCGRLLQTIKILEV